jgi:hypothetical protein
VIEITRLAKKGGPLTKRIGLDGGGKLISDGSACVMARGRAARLALGGLDDLAEAIAGLGSDEAIALGALRPDLPDRVDIAALDLVNGTPRPDLVARIGANISFRAGAPGLVLLDHDAKGMPADVERRLSVAGGFWGALVSVLPALAGIGRVERASTSAGLYRRDTGERLRGSDGRHLYICVTDGADAARFLKALHDRCWLAGFGWLMVGMAGQLLERSIVDFTVGSPERLVFEGPPLLGPPLAQDTAARKPVVTDGGILDTIRGCPPTTIVDTARKRELLAREEHRLAGRVAASRDAWIAAREGELVARGMAPAKARHVLRRQSTGVLLPDAVLAWDDPDLAGKTVGDVLDDPARFEGETLADPLEGVDYGRCKAKVLRRSDGTPWINSFAHGRTVYELRADAAWVERRFRDAADEELIDILAAADVAEAEGLRGIIRQRTGMALRAIDARLKEAKRKAGEARAASSEKRRLAERRDPRPQLPAPANDAEYLPVMRAVSEVLGGSSGAEPPARDADGFLTAVRVRRLPDTHAFTRSGANDEEDVKDRLPAPEQPLLTRLNDMQTAELIEHHIEFVNKGRSVHLGTDFVRHFRQRTDGLPLVVAVATAPVVLGDGSVLRSNGLDRDRGIIFRIPAQLLALLPTSVTEERVAEAMRFLFDEWLCDVATDLVGRSILVADALTIIERSALPERPVFFVTGGKRGSGKTTALMMIVVAATGVRPSASAWSWRDEERRKALASYLLAGLPALVWDNIDRGSEISCPHIERASTSATYSDRLLGVNQLIVVPASTVQHFTGNNIGPTGDLASRALLARLDADRADPENREFTHPDPVGWTEANRGKILKALYTVLLGNPRLREGKHPAPETRFKAWWHLVGSAVESAAAAIGESVSFKKIFISREEEGADALDLGDMLEALAAMFGGIDFGANDVAMAINAATTTGSAAMTVREYLYPAARDEAKMSAKSVSKRLRGHLDEPVRRENYTVRLKAPKGEKVMKFYVETKPDAMDVPF